MLNNLTYLLWFIFLRPVKQEQEDNKRRTGNKTDEKLLANSKPSTIFDTIIKHEGLVLRSSEDRRVKTNISTSTSQIVATPSPIK